MKRISSAILCSSLILSTLVSPTYAETKESIQVNQTNSQLVNGLQLQADRILRDTFSDGSMINENSKQSIAYFVERGVIGGIKEGDRTFFKSEVILTRAQAARIFAQGLKLSANSAITFTDTKKHWALSDIQKVAAAKIMTGTSATTFAPEKQLTNAEIVSVLSRLLTTNEKADISSIKDLNSKHWASEAYAKLIAAGIVTPEDNQVHPNDLVNREQFAVMFYKTLDQIGKIESIEQVAMTTSGISLPTINDYRDTSIATVYDIKVPNTVKVSTSDKISVRFTYNDKQSHFILYQPKNDPYLDMQTFFNLLDGLGIQENIYMSEGSTVIRLIPPDPSKPLIIETITQEMANEDSVYKPYITSASGKAYVEALLPQKIDFMKDGKEVELKGQGAKIFTIEYNGKIDTIVLDKIYRTNTEFYDEINRQTINTKVKVEDLYSTYATKTPHFVAPDFVEGSEIIIKGAEQIFGNAKVAPAVKR